MCVCIPARGIKGVSFHLNHTDHVTELKFLYMNGLMLLSSLAREVSLYSYYQLMWRFIIDPSAERKWLTVDPSPWRFREQSWRICMKCRLLGHDIAITQWNFFVYPSCTRSTTFQRATQNQWASITGDSNKRITGTGRREGDGGVHDQVTFLVFETLRINKRYSSFKHKQLRKGQRVKSGGACLQFKHWGSRGRWTFASWSPALST